jgi:hypothetical protein
MNHGPRSQLPHVAKSTRLGRKPDYLRCLRKIATHFAWQKHALTASAPSEVEPNGLDHSVRHSVSSCHFQQLKAEESKRDRVPAATRRDKVAWSVSNQIASFCSGNRAEVFDRLLHPIRPDLASTDVPGYPGGCRLRQCMNQPQFRLLCIS